MSRTARCAATRTIEIYPRTMLEHNSILQLSPQQTVDNAVDKLVGALALRGSRGRHVWDPRTADKVTWVCARSLRAPAHANRHLSLTSGLGLSM
jgi:hypothetical protein